MNFGTPVPLLVGLILILGAVGLFFLDRLKPGYERSSDKVYSLLLLLSGIFLLAHLNMELLASFQQVMLVGMLTTLIINDITKREPLRPGARPAEREAPPRRYEERPRRRYRAELDDWDNPPRQPRIPSVRDGYRDDGYGDRYAPRPLEPRPPEPRPTARLQPSDPRRDSGYDGYGDRRSGGGRVDGPPPPSGRPDGRPLGPYDRGPDSRPTPPPDSRFSRPPADQFPPEPGLGRPPEPTRPPNNGGPSGRPPLNVRPRPTNGDGPPAAFRPESSPGAPENGSYPDGEPRPPA